MREDSAMVERAILGGLLNVGDAIPPIVLDLQPEHFTDARRATLFSAIRDLIDCHDPVDVVTVSNLLREWGSDLSWGYVCALANNDPFVSNLAHWCGLLLEYGRRRQFISAAKNALERVKATDSADDMAAMMTDALRTVRPKAHDEPTLVRDHIQDVRRQLIAEHTNPEVARIAVTGLCDLDAKTALSPSQMTIIAGRPGMGKSALAGNVAAHCARESDRGCVVIFSLEMSTHDLIRRMMASESRFPSSTLPEVAARGDLDETCDKLYRLNLHINQQAHVGINSVRAFLSKLPRIRLVVFDYLQLAEMDRNQERHDLKVGAMTKGLKAVAKEFDCHVIVLSQLNRKVEERSPPVPKISDLRDSGNIEEDADNVWLLYRPWVYSKEAPPHLAQVNIAKQRHGTTGEVHLCWDGGTQTFRNLEERREPEPLRDYQEPQSQRELQL